MKCLYCTNSIDGAAEAFVTIPNPEQCGYRSRVPTKFVHARCYERETIRAYEQRKAADAARDEEIKAAREGSAA